MGNPAQWHNTLSNIFQNPSSVPNIYDCQDQTTWCCWGFLLLTLPIGAHLSLWVFLIPKENEDSALLTCVLQFCMSLGRCCPAGPTVTPCSPGPCRAAICSISRSLLSHMVDETALNSSIFSRIPVLFEIKVQIQCKIHWVTENNQEAKKPFLMANVG